jgi:hypothetical protein
LEGVPCDLGILDRALHWKLERKISDVQVCNDEEVWSDFCSGTSSLTWLKGASNLQEKFKPKRLSQKRRSGLSSFRVQNTSLPHSLS